MADRAADSSRTGGSPAVGEKAPDFRLPSLSGGLVGPGDYLGKKKVVVAFYPKDNTSG